MATEQLIAPPGNLSKSSPLSSTWWNFLGKFISLSVCFAAYPSSEKWGEVGSRKSNTNTTYLLWVVQGGNSRGCSDSAVGSFLSGEGEKGKGEREKGSAESGNATGETEGQLGHLWMKPLSLELGNSISGHHLQGSWSENSPIRLVAGLISISLCAVSLDRQPQSRIKISHASHILPKLVWQFHIGDYA